MTRRSWPKMGLLSFLLLGTATTTAISVFNDELGSINVGRGTLWWFPVVGSLFFLVPGVVVLLRSHWHPVGWFLVNLGVGFQFSFGPDNPPIAGLSTAGLWWLWLSVTSVSAIFWTVWSGLLLVFPDRLSSRRGWHRGLAWSVLGVDAVCIALTAMSDRLVPHVNGGVASPFPLAVVPSDLAELASLLPNVVLVVALVDFIVRYRQARDPARSQYRWVVWSFLYVAGALTVAITVSAVSGGNSNPVWFLVILGYLMVPVAFMIAILRYRLYDIDRVVSRTVAYALVALTVAAVYALPVLLLPRLVGESNNLVVAASTLAAAAVFNPVRRRIQRWVDKRFDRAKYDAEREVDALAGRLEDSVDLHRITEDLIGVVNRTLSPTVAGMWLRSTE